MKRGEAGEIAKHVGLIVISLNLYQRSAHVHVLAAMNTTDNRSNTREMIIDAANNTQEK
jgi:hypothetical protein